MAKVLEFQLQHQSFQSLRIRQTEIKNFGEHRFEIVKQDSRGQSHSSKSPVIPTNTATHSFNQTQTLNVASSLRKVTVAFKPGIMTVFALFLHHTSFSLILLKVLAKQKQIILKAK